MLKIQSRTWLLVLVLASIASLFIFTVRSAGPMAPVQVVLGQVTNQSIQPALFGIGTVQARYTYKIGPTLAGRIQSLSVDVGEYVVKGQQLGEMDPVDLDARLQAQLAAISSAKANISHAKATQSFALSQLKRYQKLQAMQSVSEEVLAEKQQAVDLANAALQGAQQDIVRLEADYQAILAQRSHLKLIAPSDGLIVNRLADLGTTVVAGQMIIELINPNHLWVDTRFDQTNAEALESNLAAQIKLRSRRQPLNGHILRVEPIADTVTEEMQAKVVFEKLPSSLPPLGELAEVTVNLPTLAPTPSIKNAALVRHKNQIGVWKYHQNTLSFTPVRLGQHDLEGNVQILSGLSVGDTIVLYSQKTLNEYSRVYVKESLL